MREALSGTSSRCFTVSPALISIFGGGFWLVLVVFFVCLWFWFSEGHGQVAPLQPYCPLVAGLSFPLGQVILPHAMLLCR